MDKLPVYAIVILSLVLSGCYQVDKINISQKDGEISFYIDQDTLASNDADAYALVDFGVSKDDCESNCVMWEIVERAPTPDSAKNIISQPFSYGQTFDFMETRSGPEPLIPGRYCAGGTLRLFKNNTAVGGKLFNNCFEVRSRQ